ncbi:hypothetical protein EBT25_19280, partial [bacterium]|nr:hypothetical protein [bacterium]
INFVQITQTSTNVNSQAPAIGTNAFVAFTSGTSGSYVQKVRFSFTSTTSAINSVATVLKVYYSTVNTGTPTASQISLIADILAPAQTLTTTTASYPIELPINFAMPANTYLLVGQSVAQSANSAWVATVFGGDY